MTIRHLHSPQPPFHLPPRRRSVYAFASEAKEAARTRAQVLTNFAFTAAPRRAGPPLAFTHTLAFTGRSRPPTRPWPEQPLRRHRRRRRRAVRPSPKPPVQPTHPPTEVSDARTRSRKQNGKGGGAGERGRGDWRMGWVGVSPPSSRRGRQERREWVGVAGNKEEGDPRRRRY